MIIQYMMFTVMMFAMAVMTPICTIQFKPECRSSAAVIASTFILLLTQMGLPVLINFADKHLHMDSMFIMCVLITILSVIALIAVNYSITEKEFEDSRDNILSTK